MQLSNAPGKLLLPFANAGAKNSIPVASQIGIVAGAASLTDGFPPLTRTPIAAGGVPPSGLDMNGILYALSAALRWANAGGGYVYDGTFAADANITGYPKGARILRSDGAGYWLNTIDGNTVDPESVTVNAAQVAGWVPDLTNGIASITMTSANVTLTPAQYGKPFVVLSGELTANLNLIFPNLAGEWTVVSNCTGAFTVTAKTAAGTGVVVTPGRTRIIWGDGTNIAGAMNEVETPAQFDNSTKLATTAFVKASEGGYSGHTVVGTTTLTAANSGQVIVCAGSATITLPAASTMPAGNALTFFATGAGVVVQRAGADTIQPNGSTVTSITLNAGDTLVLESNGASAWGAIGGSAQLQYSSQFLASKAANGYIKLPGGLIIQWGTVSGLTGAGVSSFTFPVAFPTAVGAVNLTMSNQTGGAFPTAIFVNQNGSLTTCQYTLTDQGAGSAWSGGWIAIGY